MITIDVANQADLVAVLDALGRSAIPAPLYRALTVQVSAGPAWVLRAGESDEPLAIGGVYQFSHRPWEAWIMPTPAARKGGVIAGVCQICRKIISCSAAEATLGLVCRVDPANAAGKRFVRAMGFHLDSTVGHHLLFRYRKERADG